MASIDEIWLVDFGDPFPDEPAHPRPAMVVGPPLTLAGLSWVVVAPMTTVRRGLRFHVEAESSIRTGLTDTSYVQCELVRSVSRRRLQSKLGVAGPATAFEVRAVLAMLLDM